MKPLAFKALTITATALALTLSACGGGGGGGSSPSGVSGVTLGGKAVKGIIKNGNVVAEELDTNGAVIRQVGNDTTDADGKYSIEVNSSYEGGPIQITITAGVDTEMKCDIPAGCGSHAAGSTTDTDSDGVIDFGEWYKPGDGNLTMAALVAEAAANDTIGVNITPYTDLAARHAKTSGSLTASAVYDANSEVSNLLGGIDILNTPPLDITDAAAVTSGTGTEIAYAAFSAAIGALADTSSGNPNIGGALDTLESSFTGGTIVADDSGDANDDTTISLQEIIDGAQSTLSQAGTGDTSGTLASLQDEVDNAGAGGSVDPQPSDTAGSTTLTKVKAFVTDVRTWGTVIDAETKAKGDAFDAQASLASDAANMSGELLVGPALDAAIQAIVNNYDGTETGTDLSTYGLGFDSGSIANSGGTITITDGVIDGATVNITAQVPQDGATASSFTIGISSATFRSAATDADINSGTVTFTTATPYTLDIAAIDAGTASEPDVSGGSLALDVSLTQKRDQNNAALTATVTFEGSLGATLVNPTKDSNGDYNWITPKTLSLSGGVSSSDGNSLDFSLTADVTNANSFAPVGELPVGTTKADIATWSYSGDTFTAINPELTVTITWNSVNNSATVTQTWTDGNGYSNTYFGGYTSLVNAVTNTSVYTPLYGYLNGGTIWVKGEGDYAIDPTAIDTVDFTQDGSVDGVLVTPDFTLEDSSHWLDANVGLNFSLQLTGLPEASVTISADRTAYQSGTATITIAYGSRQIVINGTFTDTTSTGSMAITNQDGVTMTLNGDLDAGTGTLSYNGQTYGTIEQMSNGMTKITYTDGTFESL